MSSAAVPTGLGFRRKPSARGSFNGMTGSHTRRHATVEIVREYEPDRAETDVHDDFFAIDRSLREATISSRDALQSATQRAAADSLTDRPDGRGRRPPPSRTAAAVPRPRPERHTPLTWPAHAPPTIGRMVSVAGPPRPR